jgi:hypothetical protein
MIWNIPSVFQTVFPSKAMQAARLASRRWRKAFADEPELRADLIRLGGVLTMNPPQGVTAAQLAYEAGRRDFALQILALGGISPFDLNRMMEDPDA